MAKKKADESGESVLEGLEKKYGMWRPDIKNLTIVSTGSLKLDQAMHIGGTPVGKMIELIGMESCLAADTYISYHAEQNGKSVNSKGGTIERLWERFNKQPPKVKVGTKFIKYDNMEYFVKSKGVDDMIVRNKVLDVVKTGKQEVYEVISSKGFRIKTTLSHKFCTPDGYKELSQLNIGDEVIVHSNKRVTGKNPRTWRKDIMVKNHPTDKIKIIKDRLTGVEYTYKRIQLSHFYYEAYLNNFNTTDWRSILNSDNPDLSKYRFIPKGFHVHHEDENYLNNVWFNLKLIDPSSHGKLHVVDRIKNLSFIADMDTIISINRVGVEDTYDIKCAYPFNNYVANKFIVHNSGKSTVCLHQIAEYQKAFPEKQVALFDTEHSFDAIYAASVGVNIDALLVYYPDDMETMYNMLLALIENNLISCAVVDSQTAAIPKAVKEGEMGDATIGLQARINSKFCMKVKGLLDLHQCTLFFISQIRDKIGAMGGDGTTTTGGHAIKFYSDVRWKMWKTNDKEHESNITTIDVIKSKVGKPFGQAKIAIQWGYGFDKMGEVIDYAIDFAIVKRSGSWYSYGEDKLGQGLDKVKLLFDDNPELYEEIRNKVLEKLNEAV